MLDYIQIDFSTGGFIIPFDTEQDHQFAFEVLEMCSRTYPSSKYFVHLNFA